MAAPVLIAVSGSEPESFWGAVRDLLPAGSPIELVHVTDEGPRQELDLQFLRRPGHPRPPQVDERALAAERLGSEAILAEAKAHLGREATTFDVRGRPGREVVARAAATNAGLLVVAARGRSGPIPAGPASVGHVARFVVDHAPCPVLVVRSASV